MEKEKMDLTSTMKKSAIPFWEWNDWLFYIKNNFPYRLEDFIRSFSENQVYAKTWLIEQLIMHPICDVKDKEVWVLGSWYGTILVHLLIKKIPNIKTIHLVDYDKEALDIAGGMFKEYNVQLHHYDINFDWPKIEGDLIINTSCEHMWPMKDYPFKGLCVFQSNNFKEEQAHINCVDSLEEFVEQTGIKEIDYKGEIQFHKWDEHHKRYMVIGKK
jgi:hypothetical protein